MNSIDTDLKVFQSNLKCLLNCDINGITDFSTHFRFVFFEKGSGIISINHRQDTFIAPCFLCLSEKDNLEIVSTTNPLLHTVYFNPSVINAAFDYANIQSPDYEFSQSEKLDLYWLQAFITRDDLAKSLISVGISTGQRILECLINVNKELTGQADNFWPCRSRSYFFELLNLLNNISQDAKEQDKISLAGSNEKIKAVVLFLNENYHKKITISDLTKQFNINRTTLSGQFVEATGMSIVAYLTKIRIKMASLLLKDTTLPISEIVYRIGLEDITHFGRVFKKETGFSPSGYRNK